MKNSKYVALTIAFMCSLAVCNDADAQSSQLVGQWERELKQPHLSVVDKSKCFSGNPHNYESLAYYAWPNPDDPRAPYIYKDGMPSPEYNNYDGIKLSRLKDHVRVLTEAFTATGDKRYLTSCTEQLNIWFVDKETVMNPNLNYGQFIPGDSRNGLGHTGAVSEAYNFVYILDYIDELNECNALPTSLNKKMRKWFGKLLVWLRTSDLGLEMNGVADNHAVMYDVLSYRIAQYVNDKKTKRVIRNGFRQKRLATQIAADGRQTRELLRTKSMMYSIYNLQHIVYFCRMLEKDNIHFYSENRDYIDVAMQFVGSCIENCDSYPYQEIGDWNTYRRQYSDLLNEIALLR